MKVNGRRCFTNTILAKILLECNESGTVLPFGQQPHRDCSLINFVLKIGRKNLFANRDNKKAKRHFRSRRGMKEKGTMGKTQGWESYIFWDNVPPSSNQEEVPVVANLDISISLKPNTIPQTFPLSFH